MPSSTSSRRKVVRTLLFHGSDLSDDIVLSIARSCDAQSLCTLPQVCAAWAAALGALDASRTSLRLENELWEPHLRQAFPRALDIIDKLPLAPCDLSMKAIYLEQKAAEDAPLVFARKEPSSKFSDFIFTVDLVREIKEVPEIAVRQLRGRSVLTAPVEAPRVVRTEVLQSWTAPLSDDDMETMGGCVVVPLNWSAFMDSWNDVSTDDLCVRVFCSRVRDGKLRTVLLNRSANHFDHCDDVSYDYERFMIHGKPMSTNHTFVEDDYALSPELSFAFCSDDMHSFEIHFELSTEFNVDGMSKDDLLRFLEYGVPW